MIEVVWEFVVREETRGHFELAFGPGGLWGKLFGSCQGYRGTTVMRDTDDQRRYLVVDLWETSESREQALAEHDEAAADLETTLSTWVETRTDMGVFRILAEATVQPRSRTRQAKSRTAGRGGRRPR